MELKEFVKKSLLGIIQGVKESVDECGGEIYISRDDKSGRMVEFDIAVSVESINTTSGKAGIRVLEFVQASGNIGNETKDSTVSRIRFGVSLRGETSVVARGSITYGNE